jgi:hypothetical protein
VITRGCAGRLTNAEPFFSHVVSERGKGRLHLRCCRPQINIPIFRLLRREVGVEKGCYKVESAAHLVADPGGFSMAQGRGVRLREHHVDSLTAPIPPDSTYVPSMYHIKNKYYAAPA